MSSEQLASALSSPRDVQRGPISDGDTAVSPTLLSKKNSLTCGLPPAQCFAF